MSRVEIYAATWCPYCIRAKQLLDRKGIDYRYIDVDKVPDARREMRERGGGQTIPQIFIDGNHLGGSDDLLRLDEQGKLDPILEGEASA